MLRSLALFEDLSDRDYEALDAVFTEVSASAGKVIASEGGVGQQFVVIADGEAVVQVAGKDVARLGPGDFFGEIALIDHGFRNATISAVTPMKLLIANPSEFNRLVEEVPALGKRILGAAQARRG